VAETVVRGTTTPILLLREREAPQMSIAMDEARTICELSGV
jgi:hypothetical protein